MIDRHLVAGALALAVSVTVMAAQDERGTPTEQRNTMTAGTSKSQTFINEMAVAGNEKVELGNLAAQRAG